MPEESTTPDLVELTRTSFEAANRRDFGAMLSPFLPDAVWEAVPLGVSFEGAPAIRGFVEDWIGTFEDFEVRPQQILDIGGGIILAVMLLSGHPVGSAGRVQWRWQAVVRWVNSRITRVTAYGDNDEARAAAERLAEERG